MTTDTASVGDQLNPQRPLVSKGSLWTGRVISTLIVLLMSTQPAISETGIFIIFGSWIVTGLIIDLVIIANARRNLVRQFRSAAAGSYKRTTMA